jgi:type IV fimbrial biogenesis protein FimT
MLELGASTGGRRRAPVGGFTLIELLVTITIFAIMLAIGVPNASHWLLANRARAASEFYADGFSTARRLAVSHNAISRITLTPNANNGQMDWQIDLCFVSRPATLCLPGQAGFSSTATPAPNDPQGAGGYKSLFRSADALPPSEVLQPTTLPSGTSQVYFTSLGWVDTTFNQRLTRLRLDPASAYLADVQPVALVVPLGGIVAKCNPNLSSGDNRACPP